MNPITYSVPENGKNNARKRTTTAPVIAPFNPSQQISYHHADFVACSNAAAECRRWAQQYLAAAECYQTAANHAAAELSRALQVKWAVEVSA